MSQPSHEIPFVFLVPCHCRELLPKDFTVYTYDKEGKLQLEYPDVQVGLPSIPTLWGWQEQSICGMRELGLPKDILFSVPTALFLEKIFNFRRGSNLWKTCIFCSGGGCCLIRSCSSPQGSAALSCWCLIIGVLLSLSHSPVQGWWLWGLKRQICLFFLHTMSFQISPWGTVTCIHSAGMAFRN